MKDAGTNCSDIQPLDKTFLKKATMTWSPAKKQLTIRLDADVPDWLKGHGKASPLVEPFLLPSPDQKYLVYMRARTHQKAGTEMWALPLSGDGNATPVVPSSFNTFSSVVSPDGKWLAYMNNESGLFEIYLTAFPAGAAQWEVSTNGVLNPKWRRDGKELFFLDPADNMTAVDVSTSGGTVQLGSPRMRFHAAGVQNQQGPYSVTAEGQLHCHELPVGGSAFRPLPLPPPLLQMAIQSAVAQTSTATKLASPHPAVHKLRH